MRLRSFSWLGFRHRGETDAVLDPSLTPEDDETRAAVNHYLRLADQALSSDQEKFEIPKDDKGHAA